jgi:TolA-binding protein
MTDDDLLALRRAAKAAQDRGNHAQAMSLCRRIVERYPSSTEASDAAYYLSTGQRRATHGVEQAPNAGEKVG